MTTTGGVRKRCNPSRTDQRRLRALGWSLCAAVGLLGGCGGGGGSSSSGPAGNGADSAVLAAHCVAPRGASIVDADGRPYPDQPGTLANELSWVRTWIDETYLWYQDVRGLSAATLDAARYASPADYFDALKTPAITASGKPKDAYHFVYDTPSWVALSRSGISYGYGFEISFISARAPRSAVVAYTQPGTPAANAGIARGARVLSVDGVDLVNDQTAAGVDALNAGLFPAAAGSHSFTLLDRGSASPRTVTLTASALTMAPVQNVKTLAAPNRSVGYLQFNDHIAPAELQLVNAINQFVAAGVTDLVLDMRYNGGGYLDIASELAFMVAGPGPTAGKVFERMSFNDKNPFQLSDAQRSTGFHDAAVGFSAARGQSLPRLNLRRVYLLAGAGTCSASEAVVNGLRGVGVDVVLIGGKTCGKPYGFYPTDNCGTTYFAIQFQGVNQLGFGDYADGFAPTCAADDDFGHPLGDPSEGLLATALGHRSTGVCQAGMSRALAATRDAVHSGPPLQRPPARENRFYR